MPYRKIDLNRKSFYLIIATVAVDTVSKFVAWEKIHYFEQKLSCLNSYAIPLSIIGLGEWHEYRRNFKSKKLILLSIIMI